MNARDKFKKGDRVRLSDVGRTRLQGDRPGTVTGFSPRHKQCVRVLRDGNKQPVTYHMNCWEVVAPVLTPDVIDQCLADAPAVIKEVEESLKGIIR